MSEVFVQPKNATAVLDVLPESRKAGYLDVTLRLAQSRIDHRWWVAKQLEGKVRMENDRNTDVYTIQE